MRAGPRHRPCFSGNCISTLGHTNPAQMRFTVLFSHGNAEDLGDDQPLLEHIKAAGFAVFAYDYQGYGTSEGRPSERHTAIRKLGLANYLVVCLRRRFWKARSKAGSMSG
jgi:hypothetical protein